MQELVEAISFMEDGMQRASDGCVRSELVNRCFLSSLYEAQLATRSATTSASNSNAKVVCAAVHQEQGSDTLLKAMLNLQRATALAAQLCEYEVLTYCAISLAELQISRRDLAAASATFDGCVMSCAAIPDAQLRASLLQRVLPKSMEVCNMQGRTLDSFTRLRLLNTVLAINGRCVAEDCPICGEALSRDRACLALGCGHSFHRDCCDGWMGRKMFACGAFRAECPVCTQVDWSLKPTPAAARALEDYKAACAGVGAGGIGGGGGGSASGSNAGLYGLVLMTDNNSSGGGEEGSDSGSGSSSRSGRSSVSGSTVQGRRRTRDGCRRQFDSDSGSCCGSEGGSDGVSEDDDADGGQSAMR